jgi:hypothetical protein
MVRPLSICGCLVLAVLTTPGAAQQESPPADGIRVPFGGARTTGNPTPGTSQPEPPNLADRITLVGCVRKAPAARGESDPFDPNTPTDSRFELVNAEHRDIVPAGTGGSALTKNVSSRTFRLEAIESQLSGFVGAKVEISGQIKPVSPATSADATSAGAPTLQVEFVQKLATTCS